MHVKQNAKKGLVTPSSDESQVAAGGLRRAQPLPGEKSCLLGRYSGCLAFVGVS